MSELPEMETDNNDDEETIVEPNLESTDNIGDVSVEINVEELLTQIELENQTEEMRAATRKRLEDIMERKRAQKEMEDFDDFDIAEG